MSGHHDFFIRKQQEISVSLNDVQKQAVLHRNGALLLLASPGSGKTTTIIMRIGFLIEEMNVPPSRIKAVTFSKASARDMRERFARFFPNYPAHSVDFSTIHSLSFEVVRRHFRKLGTTFELIEGDLDTEDEGEAGSAKIRLRKKIILRNIYKELNGDIITEDQLEELVTYISYVKNKLIPEMHWSKVICGVPQAERIFREYEEFKRTGSGNNLVDFDDMLTIANSALEADKELLHSYQSRYDYILTDESQDTSLVQHSIVEKLVKSHGNLCVVADDDQSIYTWRAAEPQYLLDFKKVYPHAKILMMEQNYRSSKNIVDTANQFIKRNKSRYNKHMFTNNPAVEAIKINCLQNYRHQAKYLSKQVSAIENLREVAILYRNNSSSISLMNEFDRAGIPFYMKDGDNRFFSHWVVKDVLDFMRMSFTDKRPEILDRIYKKLNCYITKEQIAAVMAMQNNESVFDNLMSLGNLQEYQIKQIQKCKETFEQLKGITPQKAIVMIRHNLGYEKSIEKLCKKFGYKIDYLTGILNTLEDIAAELNTMEDFAKRLNHLESVMKASRSRKNENAVTFSTLHSSKGLEFERVYMIDLIQGIIPSEDDMEKVNGEYTDKVEEAVRLFYVGMTRAKYHLELLSYQSRDGRDVQESEFVKNVRNIQDPPKEQPQKPKKQFRGSNNKTDIKATVSNAHNPNVIKNVDQLTVGLTLRHKVFGTIQIIKMDHERIQVNVSTGVRDFLIKTCIDMGLLEWI